MELNPKFQPPESYYQIDNNYVFLFYPNERKLLILKLKDYEMFEYTLNTEQSSIINKGNNNFSRIGDKIYFLMDNINRDVSINYISIDPVINNMTKVGSLYNKNNYLLYLIVTIMIFLFFSFFKIKKTKKTIQLKGNNLIYGKVIVPLDKKMIRIINLLLENDFVSNVKMNEIFHKDGINKIHLNREKNNCIEKINVLYKLHTNKKLILKRKSLFDKRMTEYYINNNIY